MKVVISEDEWCSVYTIEENIDEYNANLVVEVPDELVARYKSVLEEFGETQEELRKIPVPEEE